MRNYTRLFGWVLVIAILGTALSASGEGPVGKSYFTKVNIWYEKPERLYSTNYHRGTILPVGTKVKIVGFRKRQIRFTIEGKASTFTILHFTKHNKMKLQQLFDGYFSEKNAMDESGAFSKFTEEEQKHIKAGTVAVGMSKDAVVMAYGNPPNHVTKSLNDDTWTYWQNRFVTMVVTFSDGKVLDIKK